MMKRNGTMVREYVGVGLAVVVLLVGLQGCASFKPSQAPFHLFNSALLNSDPTPAFPKEPGSRRVPTEPVAYNGGPASNDGDDVIEDIDQPEAPAREEAREVAALPPILYTPRDATGYVGAICRMNEIEIEIEDNDDAVASLYSSLKKSNKIYHATRPSVGDLVFFHNTFDRNKDGRNNDWYTHVGVVEGIDDDGTIHMLSFFDDKVRPTVLNLENPEFARNESTGKVWNTNARNPAEDDAPFTQYLGSELFAGFGNVLGARTEFIIIDNWVPGMRVSSL